MSEPIKLLPHAAKLFREQVEELERLDKNAPRGTVVLKMKQEPFSIKALPPDEEDVKGWVMDTLEEWGVWTDRDDIAKTARRLTNARAHVRKASK